jgi:hypothetical protein
MITDDSLPKTCVPFARVTLCSNEILNGSNFFSWDGVVPLLVGKGDAPLIWLQGVESPGSDRFVPVVEASVPKHPGIQVQLVEGAMEVRADNTLVLQVRRPSWDYAVIDALDLRPLGMNVVGDSRQLVAGDMTFSGNTFGTTRTAIAFTARAPA